MDCGNRARSPFRLLLVLPQKGQHRRRHVMCQSSRLRSLVRFGIAFVPGRRVTCRPGFFCRAVAPHPLAPGLGQSTGQQQPAGVADSKRHRMGFPPNAVPHFLDGQAVRDNEAPRVEHLKAPGNCHRLPGRNTGTRHQPARGDEPETIGPAAEGPTNDSHLRLLGCLPDASS